MTWLSGIIDLTGIAQRTTMVELLVRETVWRRWENDRILILRASRGEQQLSLEKSVARELRKYKDEYGVRL